MPWGLIKRNNIMRYAMGLIKRNKIPALSEDTSMLSIQYKTAIELLQ